MNPGLLIDNFAGGGGASSGIEFALGRSPDLAINHDGAALAMHRANHPDTAHLREDVWHIDPAEVTGGRPVALAWFSPDCTHHSKAKGGKPRKQKIRGLAWVAARWAKAVRPRVIILENVEEFRHWGPLHRSGERKGLPIRERRGETFRAFIRRLERLGYAVEHRLLRACDYGAPTTRRRLFLVARCDDEPIVWPEPTHGPGRSRPYRTAAECIDWSIPCPSIFDRPRPLADKTLARIARGVRKYVLGSARPFVIPVNHGGSGRRDHRVHDGERPMPTITGGCRGSHAIIAPYLDHCGNGERPGQAPRVYDARAPLGTVVAQGQKHAACVAMLIKNHGVPLPALADLPGCRMDTIATRDQKSLAVAHLVKFQGTSEQHLDASAFSPDEPLPTITAGGWKIAQVAAFLVRYNGQSDAEDLRLPLSTITTRDRFGLVTVSIDGEEYVIADIGLRMLTPRELFRAQGFPDDYVIDPIGPRGKPLTKTEQIRMVGNSVAPPVAEAIVRAQFERELARRETA